MKTEVYSWRVAPATKAALEAEARRAGTSVAALLDQMATEWISSRRSIDDDEDQKRLHAAASRVIGSIAGRDPRRSESVRSAVRARLSRQRSR